MASPIPPPPLTTLPLHTSPPHALLKILLPREPGLLGGAIQLIVAAALTWLAYHLHRNFDVPTRRWLTRALTGHRPSAKPS